MASCLDSKQPINPKDTSNYDILSEIEKDSEQFRNFRVYGYLTEMQKTKLNPILEICNEIILIGSADCPFYKSKEMELKSKDLKNTFSSVIKEVYQEINSYVISPEWIVQREKEEEENANSILKNLSQDRDYQSKKLFDA